MSLIIFFFSSLLPPPFSATLFSLKKPIVPCVPSQNGLFFDAPHLHNANLQSLKVVCLLSFEDFQQFLVACHLTGSKAHLEEVESLVFLLNDFRLLLLLL